MPNMIGPALDGSGVTKQVEVHPDNVRAFKAAGYVEGELPKPVEIFKSADTGEFVSEETAAANPKTTYKTKRAK